MRAQSPPQPDRLADVNRGALLVAQHVHRWRVRSVLAYPLAHATPGVLTRFENERLADESPREFRWRIPNPQDLGREPLIIRRIAHFGQARVQSIAQEHRGSYTWEWG